MSRTIKEAIKDVTVEVFTFAKGNGALIFIEGEYAGSAERDDTLETWTAIPLYRRAMSSPADGMWSAVQKVVHSHVEMCVKAVLAK